LLADRSRTVPLLYPAHFVNAKTTWPIKDMKKPNAIDHGLAVFLNTTAVDEAFRRFNGHTQVNATDLKLMKYPSRDVLIHLGEWSMQQETLTQPLIDEVFRKVAT